MTKRSLFGAMAGVLALTLAGQFIYSPVFAENPANISIVEVAEDGSGGYKAWEDITGAMPGMTYSAIPRVRNDGSVAVSVRMCLSESATNASGDSIELPVNTFGINTNSGWTLDNEGAANSADPASGNCYKYDTELAVGDMTEPLFTEVTLSGALGNEYENSTFNLHLNATATSSDLPEPVNPDNPEVTPGKADTASSPDTGGNTAIQNFAINSGLIFLTAGALALIVVGIRKLMRK